jgi:hypothetical protein
VLEILFLPFFGVKNFVKILIRLKRGQKKSTPQGGIAMNPGSFPSLSYGRFVFVSSQL